MATLANVSSINASTASAWNVVDATSYNNSESTTTALTTSYVASSNFTPGAITVSHIGVKLSVRTGTTGTMSVNLRNTTAGADVAGTDVTINTADLPVATTAGLDGGWHFFKLASPVLLLAATNYAVQAKTSSSSQISLFSTATTNWSRALITTATASLSAGDDMIVTGEYTGTGTSNSYTVTWDITATTDFGSAPTAANSLLTPGIALCNKGTLSIASTAATGFNMKMSNSIIQYAGSTYTEANLASDSTFELQFDPGTNVDYGFVIRGASTNRRLGKNYTYDRCLLNTDEAVNSTSLGVDTNTGWPDNAIIAVASTTRTSTQCEVGALNGAAGASTLTVDGFGGTGGGLAFAHSGTSPTQAEVIMLTRSSLWRGASASLQAYVTVQATSSLDWDWCALRWMGSNTASKRGFETACTTGTQTFDYISHYDFAVSDSRGFSMTGASGTGLAINNYVSWNVAREHYVNAQTTGTSVVNNLIGLLNTTANTQIYVFGDVGGTLTNITAAGCVQIAVLFNESAAYGTISNIVSHSNGNSGISWGNGGYGTIAGMKSWRNTANGIQFSSQVTNSLYNVTINNLVCFGNTTNNVRVSYGVTTLNNPLLAGDSTFSTTNGISNQGNAGSCIMNINSGSLGVASGIYVAHTNDINLASCENVQMKLNNTILASATEIATQTGLPPSGYITSQKHDQTTGLNKTFKRQGTITINTVTTQAGGYSMQMTPLLATEKLETTASGGGFRCAVANGNTVNVSVYVYEDASYNGARARLILKRNDAMGITADTVLATATAASDAAWEQLTGTTPSAPEDGVFEFVVDCNGTAGNLYVDTWSVS